MAVCDLRLPRLAAACALAAVLTAGSAARAQDPALPGWRDADARAIEATIAKASPGAYAVFDADNTLWRNDLEESLLAYMEMRGLLSPRTLSPALQPLPLKPGESLYGYYQRLCAVDDELCYPWIAQVFSGFSLGRLKSTVDDLMAYDHPIPVRYVENGAAVVSSVHGPVLYAGQKALVHRLQAAGVKVYIVTASLEELVRMVASDPRYGLNVAPETVVGVNLWLRDPQTGALSDSRADLAAGKPLGDPAARSRLVVTPYLREPASWYVGKVAAIQSAIDPVRRPMLVAGDSASDWWMLFYADGAHGAARVWVNRKPATTAALAAARKARAQAEGDAGLTPQADSNWIVTTPDQLR